MAIIGIDLGTTNSAVAYLKGKAIKVIPNIDGSTTTPSVVGLTRKGEILVGEKAKRRLYQDPKNTIRSIKRHMGTNKLHMFNGKDRTPQEVSSYILAHLKQTAEGFLREKVRRAVITHPAYFNEPEIKATRDAAMIAGFDDVTLMNEPTAAAMAYGVEQDLHEHQTLLVYDLGGGTFDVSVITIDSGVYEVRGISGDMRLGGDDLDLRLAQNLAEDFRKKTGVDLRANSQAMGRLTAAAEEAKIALSTVLNAEVELPGIVMDASGDPVDLEASVSRSTFEELIRPLVQGSLKWVDEALQRASLSVSDITKILLVGGSTKIPLVLNTLERHFGGRVPICKDISPDLAVAMGAAVKTALLEEKPDLENVSEADRPDNVAADVQVTAHSVGLSLKDNRYDILIPANSFYPQELTKTYYTVSEHQTNLMTMVLEGENPLADRNRKLGEVNMQLPPIFPAEAPLDVTFKINSDRILEVTVVMQERPDLCCYVKIEGTPDSARMSQEELDRLRREHESHDRAQQGQESERLRLMVEGELEELRRLADTNPDLVRGEEQAQIRQLVLQVKSMLQGPMEPATQQALAELLTRLNDLRGQLLARASAS
ncbi:MAG: Hsp70 family protein [Candidatus Riflebacteria bacterium]|nr:Hsp70 family protein [Candidatus Riflebacteria bacterium]